MNNKIQIEILNKDFEDKQVFIAVGFRGGYTSKRFIINDNEQFCGNLAMYNVLFNYLSDDPELNDMRFDVHGSSAFILCSTDTSNCADVLKKLLARVCNGDYSKTGFEEAKEKTANAFAAQYKNEEFRARLKAREVTDLNKAFTLKELINDIKGIDYDSFIKCMTTLFVTGNIVVYVVGNSEKIDLSGIDDLTKNEIKNGNVRISGFGFDPYLRQDSHVLNIARKNENIIVEAFDFINPETTDFAKQVILEIFAASLPCKNVEIFVDPLDAGIICEAEDVCSYKPLFSKLGKNEFNAAKRFVLSKYIAMMKDRSELFTLTAAEMLINGIYIEQFIEFVAGMEYEVFEEICEKADYKATEAQVILRKGRI